ncbi:hypothetical protein GN958_ATG08337 [Phytophthora infestans]|uniref:Uncharacterized protein n=1 Tax=Phytophthora infestans TaxID=4787 RepID=A0A8S9UPN8_PHYIN|nr:hypothetical protein GN958_ATG08337 [Phytophthora infestans]
MTFKCDVSDAVIETAGVGRIDVFETSGAKRNIIVECDIGGDPCCYDDECDDNDELLMDAAVAAAKRGHLETAGFLVSKIYSDWNICGAF